MNIIDTILQNPEKLLEAIGMDPSSFLYNKNEIRCTCPVHENADNPTSFCFYADQGNWKCFTKCCENINGSNPVGLIMSKYKCSVKEAYKKIHQIYGINKESIILNKNIPPYRDILVSKNQEVESEFKPINLTTFDKMRIIDDEFFPKLGFQEQTIHKFRISKCKKLGKPMYNRAYTPVIDDKSNMIVGFTGRWMGEKCSKYFPKWKHYGVKTHNNFYNMENAKEYIKKTGKMFILEGPKEVWKLDECGIFNCVAGLGINISPIHIEKAINYCCKKVYICLNNDEAGKLGAEKMYNILKNVFNCEIINSIRPPNVDFDEMENEKIIEVLKDKI